MIEEKSITHLFGPAYIESSTQESLLWVHKKKKQNRLPPNNRMEEFYMFQHICQFEKETPLESKRWDQRNLVQPTKGLAPSSRSLESILEMVAFKREVQFTPLNLSQSLPYNLEFYFGSTFNPEF
jgi:hypothetical protein